MKNTDEKIKNDILFGEITQAEARGYQLIANL